MRILGLYRTWMSGQRFKREHRPFLTLRLLDPVILPDGRMYQPGFEGIWCLKHDCWITECPS